MTKHPPTGGCRHKRCNMKIKILALAALAAVCIVCVHLGAPYAADIAVLLLMCLAIALIIKAHQREAALVERCETDSLTGLKNKACCDRLVEEKYPKLESVGVIFWDINQLKAENDRLGHLAGDQLIRKMADSLVAICDESCQAFRYGGDEFLLISENASEAQLKSLCGKWCGSTDISASFGYAYGPGSEIRDIIARADSNMYQAKKC